MNDPKGEFFAAPPSAERVAENIGDMLVILATGQHLDGRPVETDTAELVLAEINKYTEE